MVRSSCYTLCVCVCVCVCIYIYIYISTRVVLVDTLQSRTSVANIFDGPCPNCGKFPDKFFLCVENLSLPAPYFPLFQRRPTAPYRLAPRETARLVRPSGTPDLPVIHAFSFTNFYVMMMMAIDISCHVTQTARTTAAYVGSFNQPTSIRFQMKCFPAQTQRHPNQSALSIASLLHAIWRSGTSG